MKLRRHIHELSTGKRVGAVSLGLLAAGVAGQALAAGSATCHKIPATLRAQPPESRTEPLYPSGAVIGSVSIDADNIFDLENPEEDGFFYRLANKLHRVTRPNVIQQQLLFTEGDDFSPRLLEESERLLRHNRYLHDADMEAAVHEDCVVDVKVHTSDTWTLSPKISLSRAGGENKSSIGIKEMNLLGTGIAVEALYSSDVDRTSKSLKVIDNNLGNSWYRLDLRYEDNSDGQTYAIDLGKPFYSLDSTDAMGISFYDNERIDSTYDLGEVTGRYGHRSRSYDIYRGWSKGLVDDRVRRISAGVAYDEHRFSPVNSEMLPAAPLPGDRRLFYPYVGFEWTQDKYEKAENHDQISRTEDMFLGTRLSARLGYSHKLLGSDRNAWLIKVDGQTGFGGSGDESLILGGQLATRLEGTRLRDLMLQGNLKYYNRQSKKRLFYAGLSGIYGYSLDADRMLYMGGDSGLRGYPLRYQSGDRRLSLTLEERFFTGWYPFRLFHVGAAAFFDIGRTWGDVAGPTTKTGWLSDVGVGLRFGSDRSGLGNVIHVDLAFPLVGNNTIDNVQFLVSTKKSF